MIPVHYKIKDRTQVYHVDSNLTIGHAFDEPLDAKAFLAAIPAQCDVPDIQNHDDLKALLKHTLETFERPKRVLWEVREYKDVMGRIVPSAIYRGVLETITAQYGIVKLWHSTSSSWEKERGWHNYTLVIHIPSRYTIGIGDNAQGKQQIKLWEKERFLHKGNGLFVSDVNPRFKTQSHGKVTLE